MNRLYIAIFLVVMFAVGLGFALLSGSKDNNQPQVSDEPIPSNTIVMTANGYTPNTLEIKVGDTVTFENRDSEEHWPASNDHPSHKIYSELDPKRAIPAAESWDFTFTREGAWGIHDHLFPSMRATITVNR